MFFPERERTVLRYWVGSWAAVCVASCLFTVSNISVFRFSAIHFPLSIRYINAPQCQALNFQFDGHKSCETEVQFPQPLFLRAFLPYYPHNAKLIQRFSWLFCWVLPYFPLARGRQKKDEGLSKQLSHILGSGAPTVSLLCCCHFGKSHALTYYLSAHIFQ